MKFVKTQIKVNIYGADYTINFPTMEKFESFSTRQEEGGSEIDLTYDFLEGLGLPKDVAKKMEVGHLNQLVEALVAKKN